LTLLKPGPEAPASKAVDPATEPENPVAAEPEPRPGKPAIEPEKFAEKPVPEGSPGSHENPVAKAASRPPMEIAEVIAPAPPTTSRNVAQPEETEFPL
jgi:hypothetical protein